MTSISTVLLDFGGTLDSPGLHWSTQFARSFHSCGVTQERRVLDRAFVRSDALIAQMSTVESLDLDGYVGLQAGLIAEELGLAKSLGGDAARAFLAAASSHLDRARVILERYRRRFRFGLVSNFPPNLPRLLERAGLAEIFSSVIVSSVVGYRKPDPRIFALALDRIGAAPGECAMIGDSLCNDVAGAKRAGLTTVWLHGDETFGGGDPTAADHETTDLGDALGWLSEWGSGA